MKRYLLTLFLIVFSFSVYSTEFEEGKNYIILDQPYVENSVVKIFSVYCPFCYKYEKNVTPILIKSLPDNVKYEAWSISTKGKYGEESAKVLSVLNVLNNTEAYTNAKMAYYKAIHDDKKEFASADEFIDYGLNAAGISREVYDKTVNDSAAIELRKLWEPGNEIAKIQGVPAFVVNGKYLIKTDKITSLTMFNDLVNYLLSLK